MADHFTGRLIKLTNMNTKMELPSDQLRNFINNSLFFESKVGGLSDKEAIDVLIAVEDEAKLRIANGLIYRGITSFDNPEQFKKTFIYINGVGLGYCNAVLTALNVVLFDLWPHIVEACKDQYLLMLKETVRMNVNKIENVMMNAVRVLNGTGEWNSKVRMASQLATLFMENEQWLLGLKACPGLTTSVILVFSHLIVDAPVPMTQQDTFRSALINCVILFIKGRRHEVIILGRDFLLVLIRLSRIPQFEAIWKKFAEDPKMFNVTGIEDMLLRSCLASNTRLSAEVQMKIDFMLNSCRNVAPHWNWLTYSHLRGPDGGSLRAEIVRYLIAYVPENQMQADTRVQLLYFIISTAQPGAEQQWLKCCLWIDWLGFDPGTCDFKMMDAAFGTVKYALLMNTSSGQVLVNSSIGPQLANSLLEYVCKAATLFLPSASESILRSLNLAMRAIADQYGQNLQPILEHHRIDRKVHEGMREIWRDFLRGKEPPTSQPQTVPGAPVLTPPAANHIKPAKISEKSRSRSKNAEEAPPIIDLNALMKRLKGETRAKIEALRAKYKKELTDDADRSEAIEDIIQFIFTNDDKLEDNEIENAGLCLWAIAGKITKEGESVLPDGYNEKGPLECFSHPAYTIVRNLCTPTTPETASDNMITMAAGIREKDPTISYLFLFHIKGTVTNAAGVRECLECYSEVARACEKDVSEMLVSDLQNCAINDVRLFSYILPFVFQKMIEVLCANVDATQLKNFIGDIIRENIRLFRREQFNNILAASLEWSTVSQWVFWHLVHAEGIPIEWVVSIIPKLSNEQHQEALTNVLLMLKRMDRECSHRRSRKLPTSRRVDRRSDEKKQLSENSIIGIISKAPGKKGVQKLCLQQVLEHLTLFTELCLTRDKKVSEMFLSKHHMQEAIASVKSNEKATVLRSKYGQLYAVMDILSEQEQTSSRTLRGNRTGTATSSPTNDKIMKRKNADEEETNGNSQKKRKRTNREIIQLDSSDSD
ncbi:unnamed protein product [Caenorhabditis auriculariae]|uniref:SOSS complex subunit A homolog n=1 Tax=Caenorhabditis auriculariae TaxID=2777116 RepID=A0A8S1GQE6_9PELO|nr:unnamed protein product [Caenorhabditis auriculariae]